MPSSSTLAAQAPSAPPPPSSTPDLEARLRGHEPVAGVAPARGARGGAGDWRIEPLQGWHLPLLDDPSFLPLQPLLQRSLLLAVPDRLLSVLGGGQPLASQALVALQRLPHGQQRVIGLIVCRRLNRSGSSWQVEHLRLPLIGDGQPGRHELAGALLREALQRTRRAASWFAISSSLDSQRLAWLREQGFQPQRTDQLWRWRPQSGSVAAALPAGLQLLPLQRRTAPLLWHLEQAACPAQLRQLLDRRCQDLLDQSGSRGWMLVDSSRREAVAGLRWLADQPEGGARFELSLHPGWPQLLGPPCELLLRSAQAGMRPLWLASEAGDRLRRAWLLQLGAEPREEEVLMARSVWRRQQHPRRLPAVLRIQPLLEPFQPRRRPLPTPLGGLPSS